MSDKYDDLAGEWFKGLPHLQSEERARRYLAKFLRDLVDAELAAKALVVQDALFGSTCQRITYVVDDLQCGKAAVGMAERVVGNMSLALCESCMEEALANPKDWGLVVRMSDLFRRGT